MGPFFKGVRGLNVVILGGELQIEQALQILQPLNLRGAVKGAVGEGLDEEE